MNLKKVVFTGIDEFTDVNKLSELQEKYSYIEFGVLFSIKHQGVNNRYPHIHSIFSFCKANLNLSAHFCGWYSKQVLEKNNFSLITNLPKEFKRVQLNYSFDGVFYSWDYLIEFLLKNQDRSIIIQNNEKNNRAVTELIISIQKHKITNLHILNDSSGGLGIALDKLKKPYVFENIFTGYAGGISDENIEEMIEKFRVIDEPFFIDMESGIRTNNFFDIDKVKNVLAVLDFFKSN